MSMNTFHTLAPEIQKRRRVEILIALDCAMALIRAGYNVGVFDGAELVLKDTTDLSAVMSALFSTDEDQIIAYKDGKRVGWVQLIYGNGGWDVIADHTANLEAVLAPVNDFANTLDDRS